MCGELVRIEAVKPIEEKTRFSGWEFGAAPSSVGGRMLLVVGLGLFAILIWRIGPASIGGLLLKVGWSLPLVFLPHALVTVLEASGWWFAFSRKGCPIKFKQILRFTVSAKAVQLMTPSMAQAGELVKIHLLRHSGVRADVSVASVISAKTTMTIAELLFIGFGLVLALSYVRVEPYVVMSASIGIILMGLFVIGVLAWQRFGLFRSFVWVSQRLHVLARFLDQHQGLLSSTDGMVKEFLRERRRFGLSCGGYFFGWVVGALEAWVFLSLLGLPNDVLSALVIQVWLVIVTRLTAFMPANLGTQEAGALMIFSLLGLAPEPAMAFSVLRRLRQIGWTGAGVGLLAKSSRV